MLIRPYKRITFTTENLEKIIIELSPNKFVKWTGKIRNLGRQLVNKKDYCGVGIPSIFKRQGAMS